MAESSVWMNQLLESSCQGMLRIRKSDFAFSWYNKAAADHFLLPYPASEPIPLSQIIPDETQIEQLFTAEKGRIEDLPSPGGQEIVCEFATGETPNEILLWVVTPDQMHLKDLQEEEKELLRRLRTKEQHYRELFTHAPVAMLEQDTSTLVSRLQELNLHTVEEFDSFVGQNPDAIQDLYGRINVKNINRAMLDLLGAESAEDLTPENLEKIFFSETEKSRLNRLRSYVDGNLHDTYETEIHSLDGTHKYLMSHRSVTPGHEAEMDQLLISIVDMTRIKLAEKQLAESRALYRLLADSSSDWIWMLDKDLKIIYSSPAVKEIFGLEPEDVIGLQFPDLMSPDTRRRFDEFFSSSASGVKESGRLEMMIEADLERPDGTSSTVEILLQHARNEKCDFAGYQGSVRDITSRKKVERALVKSEASLRAMIDHIPHPIFLRDQENRLILSNISTREMLEESRDKNGNVDESHWFRQILQENDREFIFHDTPVRMSERRFSRKMYQDAIVDIHKIPLGQPGSSQRSVMTIVRDISGEARIREKLIGSYQEMERFAAAVSHDLKAPLRTIINFLQLLERHSGKLLDEKAREYIDTVLRAANRQKTLITDLVTYARIGSREKELQQVDMNRILQQVYRAMKITIERSGGNLSWENLPVITAYKHQIMQLFHNLVHNAFKFHGEVPPVILVTCRKKGDAWIFCVEDNGIGIAPEYHEQIYGVFKRLHTQEEYPGTGTGLALCKKVAENHGGRIWVESQVGKGSRFFVAIPELLSI